MGMSLTPLLMYSEYVSAEARSALRIAHTAPADQRRKALEAAARVLFREADLSCSDVREIVGLESVSCD